MHVIFSPSEKFCYPVGHNTIKVQAMGKFLLSQIFYVIIVSY